MYSVTMVCTGNICRSPMAEYMLREALKDQNLLDKVHVDSAATTAWEAGNPMNINSQEVLNAQNIPKKTTPETPAPQEHRARKFEDSWLKDKDLILVMDHTHYNYFMDRVQQENREKIKMIRDFDPNTTQTSQSKIEAKDIDDPYYGTQKDFENTYEHINNSLPGVVNYIKNEIS